MTGVQTCALPIYKALAFYGHNIVASEGEEWKKYRKISAPAFSDVSLPCDPDLEIKVTWT